MSYEYFVSYAFPNGTGMITMKLENPLTSGNVVHELAALVSSHARQPNVTLVNFQLLSGPRTCATCGNHRAE